jgi:hypothetical protein
MSNKKQEPKQNENTQSPKDKPKPYPSRDFKSGVQKPKGK